MLVLTRRVGEALLLSPSDTVDPNMTVGELFANGPIEISVARIKGCQAQVHITAPVTINIVRDELTRVSLHKTERNKTQILD